MDIKAINTAILQGNFTNDQLTSIVDAVKYARARLVDQNKRSLQIGQRVTFNSSRLGRNVPGTVTKISIKNVTVDTAQGVWRVPANMLTAA
jgi:small-conductance mechanosensitive channel